MENLPAPHPLASTHLPFFITGAGQTDVLFNIVVVFVVAMVIVTGVIYFRLHSLPDHMMHGRNPAQYQIVAVLVLLSLLSQNHIFWIAALLLAVVDVPSLFAPLSSMAGSLSRISQNTTRRRDAGAEPEAAADGPHAAEIAQSAPAPEGVAEAQIAAPHTAEEKH